MLRCLVSTNFCCDEDIVFNLWLRLSWHRWHIARALDYGIKDVYFHGFLNAVVEHVRLPDAAQMVVDVYFVYIYDGGELQVYVIEYEVVSRRLHAFNVTESAITYISAAF